MKRLALLALLAVTTPVAAQQNTMSFFITSADPVTAQSWVDSPAPTRTASSLLMLPACPP